MQEKLRNWLPAAREGGQWSNEIHVNYKAESGLTIGKLYAKSLLDRGAFCGATGTLCFGLGMTWDLGFMGFKVRVDSSSLALFCHLCTMILRVISCCLGWTLNPDRSPVRGTQYHCTRPTRPIYATCRVPSYFDWKTQKVGNHFPAKAHSH